MKKSFEVIAKTFEGLEDTLIHELNNLGINNSSKLIRGVKFTCNDFLLYSANYHCRTALCFLKQLFSFKAKSQDTIYSYAYNYSWENVISVNKSFAIESTVNSKFFNHSKYIALKTKDAIVDRFRDKYGHRPSVDKNDPDIKIHIHISHDNCDILINSSGEPLYKRGYRLEQHKAPLNEVLAAGMIMLSGWDGKISLIDPMCGSGTILIEAAMIALNIPPGKYRKKYAFQNWNDYDEKLFNELTKKSNINTDKKLNIIGSDISKDAYFSAKKNIRNAQLSDQIKLIQQDFFKFLKQSDSGLIITNPPYGKRINNGDIISFYKEIGNQLKNNYSGYTAWLLSDNTDALKFIGLKPDKKITLFNGPLKCKFQKYTIYAGSKKTKYLKP